MDDNIKRVILLFSIVFMAATIFMGSGKKNKIDESHKFVTEEKYPSPWIDSANSDLIKTLGKNKISGCSEFKYRKSVDFNEEYLVHCTNDGVHWNEYIVWTSSNRVTGPYAPSF